MRRAAALAVVAVVTLVVFVLLGDGGSALVGRASAGEPLTITFKGANGSTDATVTITADGTYQADFGIPQPGDYTATIKRSNGRNLATIPISVTPTARPCLTPTAGTGAAWGVTHSPYPVDPKFPSYVTVCGRVALASAGNSATPAGSPPSLGEPSSVSRDDPGNASDGVLHGDLGSKSDDDGGSFPWFVVLVAVVALAVVVGLVWQHGRARRAASTPPGPGDTPE